MGFAPRFVPGNEAGPVKDALIVAFVDDDRLLATPTPERLPSVEVNDESLDWAIRQYLYLEAGAITTPPRAIGTLITDDKKYDIICVNVMATEYPPFPQRTTLTTTHINDVAHALHTRLGKTADALLTTALLARTPPNRRTT